MSRDVAARFGLFGKVPGKGDFVRARMETAFVDAATAWSTGFIAEGRDLFGEAFADSYTSMPQWRFVVAGDQQSSYAGVAAASADAGGRLFPLFAAARLCGAGDGFAWLQEAEDALDAAGRLMKATIWDGVAFEQLESALAELEAPPELRGATWLGIVAGGIRHECKSGGWPTMELTATLLSREEAQNET